MSRDRFGVPANAFGPVNDDFYGLVGRVVMMAALVEDRLITLLNALTYHEGTDPIQAVADRAARAGRQAGELLPLLRTEFQRREDPFGADGIALADRLRFVFDRRNEIVHSLWPHPTHDSAWGHRTVRQTKGQVPNGDYSAIVITDGGTITALINQFADLYNEIVHYEERATRPENALRTDVPNDLLPCVHVVT